MGDGLFLACFKISYAVGWANITAGFLRYIIRERPLADKMATTMVFVILFAGVIERVHVDCMTDRLVQCSMNCRPAPAASNQAGTVGCVLTSERLVKRKIRLITCARS